MNSLLVTKYHNNSEMKEFLHELTATHPDKTHLYAIGKSVSGEDILVIAIAGTFPDQHLLLRPELRYMANMHGNEVVSRELLLYFAQFLLESYETHSDVTKLLDKARIHLMPSMNPDGHAALNRTNQNNVDLNRDFPDRLFPGEEKERQPETLAVIQWLTETHFLLSGDLHGGALVADYPWNNIESGDKIGSTERQNSYSKTPEDDLFIHLANSYASLSPTMIKNSGTDITGAKCKNGPFKNGIVNGNQWYTVNGGIQDYSYWRFGTPEVTLEVSCAWIPDDFHDESPKSLPLYWNENMGSLLNYMIQSFRGVRGLILDGESHIPVTNATVSISSIDKLPAESIKTLTTEQGEYWRILLPGKYCLEVSANEYTYTTMSFVTVPDSLEPVSRDIFLYDGE